MQVGDEKKQASLDVAEDARQSDWQHPSFVGEMFKGEFRWEHIHPFPLQDEEDKKIGDEYLEKLKATLEQHIDPSEVDRTGVLPQEAIKALGEMGAFGMKIPKEYGGLGLSQTNYSRACAFISTYCGSTSAWITAHQSIGVPQPLKLYGTEEQKKKFLPRFAAGEISAFALTEPGVGSDPAKMTTTAEPTEDGNHWVINGTKLWCTNGTQADIIVVMARTPDKEVNGKKKRQMTAFIVETNTPGFDIIHRCDFMGLRGIQNGLLGFDNVKVPKENIIGEEGAGLRIALATLNTGRLSIPATSAAGGKAAILAGSKWAKSREQWGAPIGKHQNTAQKVARFAANTLAMEAVTWLGCSMADRGGYDFRLEAAMAKYFTTVVSWQTADDFVQVRGGRGYETAESLAQRGEEPVPAERFLRDSRISRIIEGTDEIMRLFIAREAMDPHFRNIMPLLFGKNKVGHFFGTFLPFYATWYPKQWLWARSDFEVANLNSDNQAHLHFIASRTKRLARVMFHTMGKYQQRLEREQLLLANFVDIGTDLFAMAATLSYTDRLLEDAPDKEALQDACHLFCLDARKRVTDNFKAVKSNHNRMYTKVANAALEGKYDWMCEGIYDEVPEGYKKFMNQSIDAYEARRQQRGGEAPAESEMETVAK